MADQAKAPIVDGLSVIRDLLTDVADCGGWQFKERAWRQGRELDLIIDRIKALPIAQPNNAT